MSFELDDDVRRTVETVYRAESRRVFATLVRLVGDLTETFDTAFADPPAWQDEGLGDDRLRLIFTCCNPSLAMDAQIALTLREATGRFRELEAGSRR